MWLHAFTNFVSYNKIRKEADIHVTASLGFASLAVDIGLAFNEKARLSAAVDSAALAGAQEIVENPDNAVATAKEYLSKNGLDPADAEVKLTDDGNGVSVSTNKKVKYFLARVIGKEEGLVGAHAAAKTAPITAVYSGIRPFAIEQMELEYGAQYVLKEGGGDGSNGNYGALALGGNGACKYRSNIINGYNSKLKVGDYVDTEPGNMSGPTYTGVNTLVNSCSHCPKCTFDNYDPGCPRIITVIIVDSLSIKGRKSVKIVGFASFFLEGVEGQGNESIVKGRFIKTVTCGETDDSQADFGLKGIRLVK